tara:strand:+ start:1383 stop:2483 length:1101 start_codon:yes stop_codon:yes gene_type:complete
LNKVKNAILLLNDGRSFEGQLVGLEGETIGEVCFNTGITGYQEILTDPSYCQQIVVMASPHIGNYGVNKSDEESDKVQVSGFIFKEETTYPSNWRSEGSISDYLIRNNITGIKNVDTRAIVSHIRDKGVMNGIISSIDYNKTSLLKKLEAAPSMDGLDLVKEVTCHNKYLYNTNKNTNFNVAVIDFGIKRNILRLISDSGCKPIVFPANVSKKEILEEKPDGIFLSNGPGDPSAATYAIKTVQSLLGCAPIFGICLGHQILALALGASTFKLKFGHRGINHPVKNIKTGRIEITSQNHGFGVEMKSLSKNIVPTHINLNDNTLAGLSCPDYNAFSVQYHPESSPGPHDSRYLFEHFIHLMQNGKKN